MTRLPLLAALCWAFTLLTAPAALAQETCLLVPASLGQRAAQATLVVEARVAGQQAVADARGNIYTLNQLDVYKVFQGQLPAAGVRLAERGGTLGLRREDVTGTAALSLGQQGLFFLEADPAGPDRQAYRLVAGPQGFVRYDAPTNTAAEPFARYRSIENELYPAVERSTGRTRRELKANTALEAAVAPTAARATAPGIDGFAPASLSAGTGTVLTISGSGFGTQGSASKVEFPNADQGGQSYVAANSTDYVLWTDTQIQVRVPSRTGSGGAGSGAFRVTTADGLTASSPTSLAVVYSYSNVAASGGTPARPRLINDNAAGGYTLQYGSEFAANADAVAAFGRALATWQTVTRLNLSIGATAAGSAVGSDGVNIVRFDTGNELPSYVLGQTTSRYSGCITGGVTYWTVTETDYNFSQAYSWNFATTAPASSQFDFESVALHEQGHGQQLGHIIRPGSVMHYSIGNGQQARTLSLDSDVPGVQAVIDFSLNSVNPCGASLIQLLPATVLPVELLSFAGRYEPALPGTRLSWATATEQRSAYFAVQVTSNPADGSSWQEITRVVAAGSSTTRRDYQSTDPRPLAAGQVRYYRLRQVDTDGPEYFSAVVAVTGGGAVVTELQAYPNPANDVLHVQVPLADNAASGRLTLVDAAGRLVLELRPAAAAAFDVPVAQLRNGVYLLQWQAGAEQVLRRRVVVQH